jgi:hypothetical protein
MPKAANAKNSAMPPCPSTRLSCLLDGQAQPGLLGEYFANVTFGLANRY